VQRLLAARWISFLVIPGRGDDGARAVGATDDDDDDDDDDVGGRRRGATYGVIDNDRQKFRSTDIGFFIPWRVVAEESGAAQFGLGGAMLLDRLGPMVRPPAAPSISILVICRFGATMELGRSERTSHGVDAANTPDRKPR
jgi:hypothetical protein